MTGLQLVGLVSILAFVGICVLLALFVIADTYDDNTDDDPWWDGRRCHTRRMRALGDCTARARHGSHPAEGGGR